MKKEIIPLSAGLVIINCAQAEGEASSAFFYRISSPAWFAIALALFMLCGVLLALVVKYRRDSKQERQESNTSKNALFQDLVQTNDRLKLALEASGSGVWETDLVTRRVKFDDQIKAIFDIDMPGNELSVSDWDVVIGTRISPKDLESSICRRESGNLTESVIFVERSKRYVQYYSRPIYDESGKPVRRIGLSRDVTERERLIRELMVSKDAFAVALESSNAGYWEIPLVRNADGQYVIYFEENFKRLFRVGDISSMTTTEWSDYLMPILDPPDAYDDFHAFLRGFDATVERVISDARLKFEDGAEIYIKNSAQLAYDQYGNPDKMIGMCVDITERIRELETARSLSETLLNSMRQMIYVVDIDTDEVLFINDVMMEAFQVDSDYQGKKYWQLFKACNIESVMRAKQKLDQNPGESVTWEIYQPYLKKELSCVARYITWIDGRTVCFRTYFDISDIKRAERALQEQLKQQRLMADISKDFIQLDDVEVAIQKSLTAVGEAMDCYRVVVGLCNEEKNGIMNEYEWHNPRMVDSTREKFLMRFDQSRESYQRIVLEKSPYFILNNFENYSHLRNDPYLKSILFAPFFIDDEFYGTLEFMSADENHIWTEGEIQMTTMVASILSMFFSRQRISESLVRATQAAESANNAKSAFLSNMSHEMRTPLNAIIGMTDIAIKKDTSPEVAGALQSIHAASRVLLELVNNVLDMSKIEAAKLELSEEYFELDDLIKNLYRIVSVRALEKRQRVLIDVQEDVPKGYLGDALRLNQILTNILYNAVKFSDDDTEISMKVELADLRYDVAELRFVVTDQGVGISEEQIQRIFNPFEQGDLRTVRRFGGSGLGLTISKEIAELMGGGITVASKVGVGSVFTLTVKLRVVDLKAPQGPEATLEELESMDWSDKRILLVEDVAINREIAKAMLESTGVQIDEAADGRRGVELFRDNPGKFDLILMDIQMPELDGYGAAHEIRELDKTIPIIAMTANAFKEDVERSRREGMNDHIIKPVDKRILLEKILRFLA